LVFLLAQKAAAAQRIDALLAFYILKYAPASQRAASSRKRTRSRRP